MSHTPLPATGNRDHKSVARGAGAALFSRLGAVVEVVAQPAYVAMFGLATYGLYMVLWSLVNLVENIADLGMTSGLQRVVPQARDERHAAVALRAGLVMGVGPSILLAAIASLAAPWLAAIINVAPADRPSLEIGIQLFAWALPLWAFIEVSTSALRARQLFGQEIRLRIFWEQVIRLGLATLLWIAGVDTLGLLLAHLASLFLTACYAMRLLSRHYDLRLLIRETWRDTTNRRITRATALAGVSVLPSNVVTRLFGDAPPVVLNLWFPGTAGATAAGVYGVARKLSSLVQLPRAAFSYVVGPLASAAVRDNHIAVGSIYGYATRLTTAMTLPVAVAVVAGGEALLRLFGSEAAAAWPTLCALTAARTFEGVTGHAAAVQQVISRHRHPLINSGLGVAIAAALGWLLLDPLGTTGLAIAVAAGMAASAAAAVVQLYAHEGLQPYFPPYGRTLAVSLLLSALLALVVAPLDAAKLASTVGVLVIALLVALWLALRFGLDREDRRSLGSAAHRLALL